MCEMPACVYMGLEVINMLEVMKRKIMQIFPKDSKATIDIGKRQLIMINLQFVG